MGKKSKKPTQIPDWVKPWMADAHITDRLRLAVEYHLYPATACKYLKEVSQLIGDKQQDEVK